VCPLLPPPLRLGARALFCTHTLKWKGTGEGRDATHTHTRTQHNHTTIPVTRAHTHAHTRPAQPLAPEKQGLISWRAPSRAGLDYPLRLGCRWRAVPHPIIVVERPSPGWAGRRRHHEVVVAVIQLGRRRGAACLLPPRKFRCGLAQWSTGVGAFDPPSCDVFTIRRAPHTCCTGGWPPGRRSHRFSRRSLQFTVVQWVLISHFLPSGWAWPTADIWHLSSPCENGVRKKTRRSVRLPDLPSNCSSCRDLACTHSNYETERPRIDIYCHYLPVSGLGNLRACCLPWMW